MLYLFEFAGCKVYIHKKSTFAHALRAEGFCFHIEQVFFSNMLSYEEFAAKLKSVKVKEEKL